jgi:hypothetical protein
VYLSRVEPIEVELGGNLITIRFIDSLDPETLYGGFNLPKLKQIAKKAKELKEYIEQLKRTEIIKYLAAHGVLADNDLLMPSPLADVLDIPDNRFDGLLKLPECAKKLHPRNRPDYARLLTKIYLHIREHTYKGHTYKWHDKEVADILNDLLPDAQPDYDEFNLKEWRQRHGLKDEKPILQPSSELDSSQT